MGGERKMADGSYAEEQLPIPISAQVVNLAIACTSTASTSQSLPGIGNIIRVVNEGPDHAYISVGVGSQTATVPATSSPTVTCTPILAGSDVSFSIPNAQLSVSAVCRAAKTSTLIVSVGEGV